MARLRIKDLCATGPRFLAEAPLTAILRGSVSDGRTGSGTGSPVFTEQQNESRNTLSSNLQTNASNPAGRNFSDSDTGLDQEKNDG
ncbi:Uncharacterized protein DAT39_020880, partial [Clarias magur]